MIKIAVFRYPNEASKWLCFNQYQGTDQWETEFPYLNSWEDLQGILHPAKQTKSGFKDINVLLDVASKDGFIKKASPKELADEMISDIDSFYINKLNPREQRVLYNVEDWETYSSTYTISEESKHNGLCFLCHHTSGYMIMLQRDNYVFKRGGLRLECMHNYIDDGRKKKTSFITDV